MGKEPSFDAIKKDLKNIERFVTKLDQSERMLRRHTEFERLIAEISSELAGISGIDIDPSIVCALGFVGAFIGADRACIIHLNTEKALVDIAHEWCADGISPGLGDLNNFPIDTELPYFYEHIRTHHIVQISSVGGLPPEAHRERIFFESRGVQALLVIPMESAGTLEDFLCFNTFRNPQVWSEEDQNLLRFLGGTISLVLERKAAAFERERLISKLETALADVKTLSGLLPICSFCKKIRDDKGYWNQLEEYIQEHSDAMFSHSICKECMVKHYSDLMS